MSPGPQDAIEGDMDLSQHYDQYWKDPQSAPPAHDPTTSVRKRMLAQVVGGKLGGTDGKLALDLGCGTGEFTGFLSELGFRAVGVDVSENALAEARNRYPGLAFEVIPRDGRLPLSETSVDLVWSSEVIEHVFDVAGWVAEASRVLKPNGLMVLTTPYHGLLKTIGVSVLNFERHFDPLGSHIRFFIKRSLARCLLAGGLRPEVWSGYGRPWPLWKSFFLVARKMPINDSSVSC